MEKKYKEKTFNLDINLSNFLNYNDMDFNLFIEKLKNKIKEFKSNLNSNGWDISNILIKHTYEDIKLYFRFNVKRLETDKELATRLKRSDIAKAAAKVRKKNIEKKEKELLEKLKKKYKGE